MKAMTQEDIEKTIKALEKYSGPLQAIVDAELSWYRAWLNYYKAVSGNK